MKNVSIGFWEILFICLTAVIVAGMITGYDVDVGAGNGCVNVHRSK